MLGGDGGKVPATVAVTERRITSPTGTNCRTQDRLPFLDPSVEERKGKMAEHLDLLKQTAPSDMEEVLHRLRWHHREASADTGNDITMRDFPDSCIGPGLVSQDEIKLLGGHPHMFEPHSTRGQQKHQGICSPECNHQERGDDMPWMGHRGLPNLSYNRKDQNPVCTSRSITPSQSAPGSTGNPRMGTTTRRCIETSTQQHPRINGACNSHFCRGENSPMHGAVHSQHRSTPPHGRRTVDKRNRSHEAEPTNNLGFEPTRGQGLPRHRCESTTSHRPEHDSNLGSTPSHTVNVLPALNNQKLGNLPRTRLAQHGSSTNADECIGQRFLPSENVAARNTTWAAVNKALAGTAGKGPRKKNPPGSETWPLHLKQVNRVPIRQWDPGEIPVEAQCFTSEAYLKKACDEAGLVPDEEMAESKLTSLDIEALRNANLIRPIAAHEVKAVVKTFSIVEVAKRRRRFIAEPQLNKILKEPGASSLTSPEEIVRAVSFSHACTSDMPWFYGQFELEPEVQPYYCLHHDNQWFALTTIPTGSRQASALADRIMKIFAKKATHQTKVVANTYIDNLRLAGEYQQCEETMRRFKQLMMNNGFTTNPENDGEEIPRTQYQFLGYHIDHDLKNVSLTQSHKGKITAWREEILTWYTKLTPFVCITQVIGFLNFASQVLAIPRGDFYYCFKYMRGMAAKNTHMQENVMVWKSVVNQLVQWCDTCISTPPRHIWACKPRIVTTIFTDACPSGYGIIIIPPIGPITTTGGKFWNDERIEILETRAILYAICMLHQAPIQAEAPQETSHMISLFVDNTSAIAICKRNYSSNFTLNMLGTKIRNCATTKGYDSLEITYIHTSINPSDPLSRMFEQQKTKRE